MPPDQSAPPSRTAARPTARTTAAWARNGEILPFTALRGLAAWWVALYHFNAVVPAPGLVGRFLVKGPLAVDLFFIMSGFVMTLSYRAMFDQRIHWRDYGRFIGVRLARIYPLHLLMLILFLSVPAALAITGRDPIWGQLQPDYFLASLLLIQNWRADSILDWNVPAWSISTEFLFYIAFPAIALLGAKAIRHPAVWALATAGLLAAIALSTPGHSYTWDYTPQRCIPECVLGMLLFAAAAAAAAPPTTAGALALAATAAGLIVLDATGLASDQATMPLAFACLLLSLLAPRFWLARILAWAPLRWIGEVSFSTYLVHFLVKYWIKFLLGGRAPTPVLLGTYIAVVAVASLVLHAAIEVPGRRFGRKWTMHLFAPHPDAALRPDAAPRPSPTLKETTP